MSTCVCLPVCLSGFGFVDDPESLCMTVSVPIIDVGRACADLRHSTFCSVLACVLALLTVIQLQ